MSDDLQGKLSAQINFGVTEETKAAAEKIERTTGIRITHIARAGFIKELQVYRHGGASITPAEIKAIAAFKKVIPGGDIASVLAAEMRASVQREAEAASTCAHPPIPSSTGGAPVVVRQRRSA